MKKLVLVLSLSLMTSMVFANDVKQDKKEESKKENTTVGFCCTATLTYNGQYYDHQETCSNELPTQDADCAAAKATLLKRNPAADMALNPK